jgi:predicted DNA-binding protein
MLTIELEPDTQQLLDAIAQKEHRSPNEIIKQLINTYIKGNQESELLVDIIKELPEFPSFADKDPLELQREMRDEWD